MEVWIWVLKEYFSNFLYKDGIVMKIDDVVKVSMGREKVKDKNVESICLERVEGLLKELEVVVIEVERGEE